MASLLFSGLLLLMSVYVCLICTTDSLAWSGALQAPCRSMYSCLFTGLALDISRHDDLRIEVEVKALPPPKRISTASLSSPSVHTKEGWLSTDASAGYWKRVRLSPTTWASGHEKRGIAWRERSSHRTNRFQWLAVRRRFFTYNTQSKQTNHKSPRLLTQIIKIAWILHRSLRLPVRNVSLQQ